jgi:hypothetical protein
MDHEIVQVFLNKKANFAGNVGLALLEAKSTDVAMNEGGVFFEEGSRRSS